MFKEVVPRVLSDAADLAEIVHECVKCQTSKGSG